MEKDSKAEPYRFLYKNMKKKLLTFKLLYIIICLTNENHYIKNKLLDIILIKLLNLITIIVDYDYIFL
ncbi:hypothetical protein AN1V17_02030 [Vallitalea sediminicola]